MNRSEKKAFFALLADVHDMYDATCSPGAAEFWFSVLEAQELSSIRSAMEAHARHALFGSSSPLPVDVMREIMREEAIS